MSDQDVIVLGSGANELVLACYLAKAGQRVTVLEPDAELGGVSRPLEIPGAPGFRLELAADTGWVAPKIVSDLGLGAHGFEESWPAAAVVTARPDARPLVLWTDLAKAEEAIREHSAADAANWKAFASRMGTLAGFLQTLYLGEPPRLLSEQAADLFSLMAVGLRLRRLGKIDMIELLRTLPMSVQDLLDDWFESDLLKAAIGAGGVTNLLQGPRSAGTGFVLLHHAVGRPIGAFRARRVVTSERGRFGGVLARAAMAFGVKVRTNARARKILVDDGRAVGVTLESGEELRAQKIVSGADPRTTFLRLVDPAELSPEVVRAVQNVKLRGARAIVSLALGELPSFPGVPPEALDGVISLAQRLDDVERAYDDAKHGGLSRRPILEASIPSLGDPSLAPAGKHVMRVEVQYVPYALRTAEGTWDEATKQALIERVVARLGEVAPRLPAQVVAATIHGPRDIEARFGLAEGHLDQGELTLDQILFMRPIPGSAHYRTPIEDLWLCGAACHPGGGLPGLAGANAARELVREL